MKKVAQLLAAKAQNMVWSIGPNVLVLDALKEMALRKVGALVVVENQKLVGIFSERDYARKGIIEGRSASSTLVSDIMTAKVVTVNSESTIQECMEIFSQKRFRHLPVLDNEHLKGILSVGDIVNSIIQDQKDHIEYLETYIRN
jgi:CBS domain-containing protein